MRHRLIVGFLFFAAILAWNLWHHELWRDELQAWAISRAAGGLTELFRNLEFEGHPGLWHLILFPITRVTGDPVLGLKSLQFVFALGYLALLWFRSPFSLLEKSLISGSYTLSYLYGAVSRCYAPGIFLCFLFLAFPQRIARRPWLGWLLLGLIANTHFFLAVLSFFLAILWLSLESEPRSLLRGAWIYLVLSAVAAVTVLRPDTIDGRGRFGWQDDLSLLRLGAGFSGVGNAFLPVGDIFSHNIDDPVLPLRVGFLTGLVVFALVGILMWKQKGSLAAYFGFSSCLILFFWLRYGGLAWHTGLLFLFLVVIVWALRERNRLARSRLFLLLLFLNALGGLRAPAVVATQPVDSDRAAAGWIRQNHLEDKLWTGYPSWRAQTVFMMLDRPSYVMETESFERFNRWSEMTDFSPHALPGALSAAMKRLKVDTIYLVFYFSHGSEEPNFESLEGPLNFDRLTSVSDGEMDDFILYRVNSSPPP